MDYINLNENQLKAVKQIEGPLRIVAGPGSGKTRTIVSKINYILENNLAYPNEILAITFTNKAANEIKERVNVESNQSVRNIYTYHGWCHMFLRIEAEDIGIKNDFTIMDSTDSSQLVNNLIKENDYVVEKANVLNAFDKISREELNLSELEGTNDYNKTQIFNLWNKYNNSKRINGQFDFNDLITEVKKVLTTNSEIANKWKNKYKYIFIDEFQDTNNVQFEIIQSITDKDSNLTVVGDPDQNIYSWRGANIDLINKFNTWYPKAETIFLDTNYRSTPEIIEASNSLIKNNKNRVDSFKAVPFKKHDKPVKIISKENDNDEAWEITREIERIAEEGYNYQDIAIIVRSSYKTRPLESALNYYNIPYKVIGAMKFFERKEVRQTLKFLLFMVKQDDNTLLSVINEPPKKFGPQRINKTRILASEYGMTMWEYLKEFENNNGTLIGEWVSHTAKAIEDIKNNKEPSYVLNKYLNDIGYINRLFDEPSRVENINETLKIIKSNLSKSAEQEKTFSEKIIEFINNSTLSSSSDKSSGDGEVNIITSHASKGTEFPVVILYSMVEGHWPSTRAIDNNEFEEERRVVYVAMTRAMNKLIITTSNGYTTYNKPIKESRFINEIFTTKTYNYIDAGSNILPTPDVKFNENNVDSAQTNKNIFHKNFGTGVILNNDGSFIKVKFEDGREQEIMIGHKSYKVIN